MMETQKGWVDKLWDLFSSMKTGLVLLALTALVSGIGTVIPQDNLSPDKAQQASRLWQTLGFTHLYSTVWFRLLLGLLCVNLLVCTIQRFSGSYKLTFHPPLPSTPKEVPQKIRQVFSGSSAELRSRLERILKGQGFRLKVAETEDGWSITAQKRRLGYWGAYIVHIAFIILILGAMLGMFWGFNGRLMALSGDTVGFKDLSIEKGNPVKAYSVKINSVDDRFLANGERDNWYTDLSIIQGNKELARGTLSVNHPFNYDGVTYYQSSYVDVADISLEAGGKESSGLLTLSLTKNESTVANDFANTGLQPLQGTDLYFKGLKLQSQPVVFLEVYKMGSPVPKLLKLIAGQTADVFDQYKLTLTGLTNATGLEVKADPGVTVVWIGCAALLIGLMLSFYWRPLLVSGVVVQTEKEAILTVGMMTGKMSGQNEQDFAKMVRAFETEQSELTRQGSVG